MLPVSRGATAARLLSSEKSASGASAFSRCSAARSVALSLGVSSTAPGVVRLPPGSGAMPQPLSRSASSRTPAQPNAACHSVPRDAGDPEGMHRSSSNTIASSTLCLSEREIGERVEWH